MQSVEIKIQGTPATKRKTVQIVIEENDPSDALKTITSTKSANPIESKKTINTPVIDKSKYLSNAAPISPFNSNKLSQIPPISDIASLSSVASSYSDRSNIDRLSNIQRSPKTKNHARKISSPLPLATVTQLKNTSKSIELTLDKVKTSRSPSITPRRINNLNYSSPETINKFPSSSKSPETIGIISTPRKSRNISSPEPIKPFNSNTGSVPNLKTQLQSVKS